MIDGRLEFNPTQLYFSQNCCRQKQCPCFHPPGTHTRQVGFLRSCLPISHWVETTYLLRFMTFLSPPPSQLGIQGKQPTGILITGSKPRVRTTPIRINSAKLSRQTPRIILLFPRVFARIRTLPIVASVCSALLSKR